VSRGVAVTIAAASGFLNREEKNMSLGTILLIVLVLALVGVLPAWPHSANWGYAPSGILGLLVLIVLVMFVMGRI
jgi:hypothetical protein